MLKKLTEMETWYFNPQSNNLRVEGVNMLFLTKGSVLALTE